MIQKSLAGVAVGALLIGGGALSAAQADPVPAAAPRPVAAETLLAAPVATTQATNVEPDSVGSGYPVSVFTRAFLTIYPRVEYGAAGHARVVVVAEAIDTTPTGSASVTVAGVSRSATVRQGVAVVALPRLGVGTYTARASYKPSAGSQFKSSRASAPLTVVKSGSRVSVRAGNVSGRERPVVRTTVRTTSGAPAGGTVSVTITRKGQSYTKRVRLQRGNAAARFAKPAHGRWTAKVVYTGNANIKGSTGSDTFRSLR